MKQHYDNPNRPRGSLFALVGGAAWVGSMLAIMLAALSHWLFGWPG